MPKPERPSEDALALGQYRPLFLLAGTGTRRILRLNFKGLSVDDRAYDLADSVEGAEMAAQMGFNWAFLAFNWGFPPEVEEQDWESFRSTVRHFHRAGVRVIGHIQSSNCVYQGSYQSKDWYALDAFGRKIPYEIGRFYTSLCSSAWLAEVRERVRHLVEAEADGIYFETPWVGGTGIDVAEMPLGPIGSYDEHSRRAYAAAFNGASIPLILDTTGAETQQYLRWRAEVAVSALRDWSQTARDLNSAILICANNYDSIAANSFVAMGADLESMAEVQDVAMIQDFALSRLQDDGSVVANAITIGAAQARVSGKPVTTAPVRHPVGFERAWSPKQLSRALAESAALNAPLVVNAAAYRHRSEFTLLLHSRYEAQRRVLGAMNHWLEQNSAWLNDRRPISPLAVYHPFEAVRWDWSRLAPYFFGACETLLLNGLPLRIVGDDDGWDDVKIIIVPPGQVNGLDQRLARFAERGGRVICLGQDRPGGEQVLWEGWRPLRHRIPRARWLRARVNQGAAICWRTYHHFRLARWLAERLKLYEAMTQSPLYIAPPPALQAALVGAVGSDFLPRLESEAPMLLTAWEDSEGGRQWHLVNYADAPQRVTLHLGELTGAWVYTPGVSEPPNKVVGSSIMLVVDIAKVIQAPHDHQALPHKDKP